MDVFFAGAALAFQRLSKRFTEGPMRRAHTAWPPTVPVWECDVHV
jgi:hypothetical protein